METPLSGSHLGPHTRPLRPCNKAVFREAVCSSFMLFAPPALALTANTHRGNRQRIQIQLAKKRKSLQGLERIFARAQSAGSGLLPAGSWVQCASPAKAKWRHVYIHVFVGSRRDRVCLMPDSN